MNSGLGHVLQLGKERAAWELKLFFRNRQAVGFTLFFPLMLLLLFGVLIVFAEGSAMAPFIYTLF